MWYSQPGQVFWGRGKRWKKWGKKNLKSNFMLTRGCFHDCGGSMINFWSLCGEGTQTKWHKSTLEDLNAFAKKKVSWTLGSTALCQSIHPDLGPAPFLFWWHIGYGQMLSDTCITKIKVVNTDWLVFSFSLFLLCMPTHLCKLRPMYFWKRWSQLERKLHEETVHNIICHRIYSQVSVGEGNWDSHLKQTSRMLCAAVQTIAQDVVPGRHEAMQQVKTFLLT